MTGKTKNYSCQFNTTQPSISFTHYESFRQHTHTRGCWHENKGKGHQMHLKMINAGWDRHTLTLNLLCSQKWALWRPPPSFWQRWDCQIGLPATLLANREVEMGGIGGELGLGEERWSDGGGGMEGSRKWGIKSKFDKWRDKCIMATVWGFRWLTVFWLFRTQELNNNVYANGHLLGSLEMIYIKWVFFFPFLLFLNIKLFKTKTLAVNVNFCSIRYCCCFNILTMWCDYLKWLL